MTQFCIVTHVHAQQLNSEQIKIAYLYNFLKHVTWPEENQKKSFTIAVYQDSNFYKNVLRELGDRQVKQKPIKVTFVSVVQNAASADLVFVDVKDNIDTALIASDLRKTDTLLVTYNSKDKHNAMINLFLNNDTSVIEFEVNKSNIVYEGLTTSKELLLLGGTEIVIAELYRETELAMQKMRQREAELHNDLQQQSETLKATAKRLRLLDSQLEERQKIAEQRQVQLVALQKDIERQKQAVDIKEKQLNDMVNQLTKVKKELGIQQKAVEAKERESSDMESRIAYNRDLIAKQKSQIDQQGQQLNQKNVELEERSELIAQQQFYLMVLAIVICVAVFVTILLVWLFAKNKRTTRKLSLTLNNLKEMQNQLVQSEKLASLGKLTAGVAHEINTPLGIALTSTSSALESTRAIKEDFEENCLTKSQMKKFFEATEQAADLNMSSLNRVIELLNNFKQVAADQVVGEAREVNLVDYINEIMRTLSAEMKKHRVTYEVSGQEHIEVKTVPGALAQVFTNLVTNSLKHGFENKSSGNISIDISVQTNLVNITYSDNGNGMAPEVLLNIFEPFYTTKRNSGGTGLGMNIVYNIIKQKLHGDITIESSPNKGATFNLTIPTSIDQVT
ncbi:YfiR/HmsC family protein [Thalassotalea sediminis]|uniref:YfiR/HmsC family protein n=1 Tax=Thalassotalea sediminis TaxID=1759089 RepID=UPI002574886F|nr:YfiR/HmsC family protein [Thalassotalea sediminis]